MCVHIYSMYFVCCVCVSLHMWDVYGASVSGYSLCALVCMWGVYDQALSQHGFLLQVALACGTISHVGNLLK